MLTIDTSNDFGKRVEQRLAQDRIIWLVTVDASGTPQPSPVWFYWDGATVLIYSQANTAKLRNIERSPNVALHFDGDEYGGNIVIMTGSAAVDESAPAAKDIPAFREKYDDGIESIGMTAESFSAAYRVPVRVTPETLRGH